MDPLLEAWPDQNKVEAVKESVPLHSCDFCDTELVHKIAQALLPGLASACVDNTTGDLFRSPGVVAVDLRKEMADYLTQRSETFVAESVIEGSNEDNTESNDPTEIIADFVDDFVSSKRNLLSRVSGWLLSEKREDKIDDFVQEMEINGFWLMERRECVAEVLLKNVDYKSLYHCSMKFDTMEELAEHKGQCNLRVMSCTSDGCAATFCAVHLEKHDSTCSYKILPCEQKCSENIVRWEMDKHCLTVCPMKLMNCPFYQVGCQSSLPRCTIDQHCSEFLQPHLVRVLHVMHKEESEDDIERRIELMKKMSLFNELSEAHSVRSLTWKVKDLEAELKTQENGSENVNLMSS